MTILNPLRVECAGYYKIEAVKLDADGNEISRRVCADWFRNLITNPGLDRMGSHSDYLQYCSVGSGSTAPAVTDTALSSLVATTVTVHNSSNSITTTSPRYAYKRNTYRFYSGTVAGNLSECGVGWGSSGTGLYSRALILDGSGNPTTITVLSDETLDVTYELRWYITESDTSFNVTITGSGTHACVSRVANIEEDWSSQIGREMIVSTSGRANGVRMYSGALGAITSEPSGSLGGASGWTMQPYTNGSYYRDCLITSGLGDNTGSIAAMRVDTTVCDNQISFSPAIVKTSAHSLSLTVRWSWGRRP